jgi:hypothetical protein
VEVNDICKLMHYTFVNLIVLIPYENHIRDKKIEKDEVNILY